MTTETTEVAKETTESENGEKRRGGPRGPRSWRDRPTAREKVMTQNLSKFIKAEIGRDVSPETIRAVRYCLPKWNTSDETAALRKDMDRKLEKAKLEDKREKALAMLREAESELEKYATPDELGEADEDEDEEESEDEDVAEYDDDADTNDEDEEDVFGESESPQKVTESF